MGVTHGLDIHRGGEWAPPERLPSASTNGWDNDMGNNDEVIKWDPDWIQARRAKEDKDITLHQEVLEKGYPNRWGARIPVKTKWNLDRFEQLLSEYEDKEVVDLLWFGWPTGRLPTVGEPSKTHRNHKGATDFPEAVSRYIEKE